MPEDILDTRASEAVQISGGGDGWRMGRGRTGKIGLGEVGRRIIE